MLRKVISILIFVSLFEVPQYLCAEILEIREHTILDERGECGRNVVYVSFLGDFELTYEKYVGMDELSKVHLSKLLGYLSKRSLTVVNFEMLLPRSDAFAIAFLSKHGVKGAVIANNHSCDYGREYIIETEKELMKNKINPVGSKMMPVFSHSENGTNVNILAMTSKLDVECDGVVRRDDQEFIQSTIRSLNSENSPLIMVLHDDGPSRFITDYEEAKVKQLFDLGADLGLLIGAHEIKGYRFYDGGKKLGLFSIGNFLLHWRSKEEYVSIAPVIGFCGKRLVYFSVIPFRDELGKQFRILENSEFEEAIAGYFEVSNSSNEKAYMQRDTKRLVFMSLVRLLKGEKWKEIRFAHIKFFCYFLFYNYALLTGLSLSFFIVCVLSGLWVKKRIKMNKKRIS